MATNDSMRHTLARSPIRHGLRLGVVLAVVLAMASGCTKQDAPAPSGAAAVSATVQQANAAVAKAADLSDPPSFADAKRGFIAAPKGQVKDAVGAVLWDYDAFAFAQGAAPATVNPSLWQLRQSGSSRGRKAQRVLA